MNAPTLWQMVILALLFIASIPYILVLLAKLRILPLTVFLLVADSFGQWAAENRILCIILFALCVLYPVLTVVWKIVRWRQEEEAAKAYLLASARPLSYVPIYGCHAERTVDDDTSWDSDDDADMDW